MESRVKGSKVNHYQKNQLKLIIIIIIQKIQRTYPILVLKIKA